MILTILQILGALAAVLGSVAIFGPWWSLLVFGALTLLASTVAEAIQNRPPVRRETSGNARTSSDVEVS